MKELQLTQDAAELAVALGRVCTHPCSYLIARAVEFYAARESFEMFANGNPPKGFKGTGRDSELWHADQAKMKAEEAIVQCVGSRATIYEYRDGSGHTLGVRGVINSSSADWS